MAVKADFVPRPIRICKRVMDLCVALPGLVLLAPISLMIMLTIKLTSPGPALFRQRRLGMSNAEGNSEFWLYKFRSMVVDAERLTGPTLASENDPRVTPVGRLLRSTRLDEIPQLWNVLRGDMSLVGPRPERPELAGALEKRYPLFNERTNAVKPGITGFAQVEMSYGEAARQVYGKIAYDYAYAVALSDFKAWLRMDCWVLFKTISVIITGRGG